MTTGEPTRQTNPFVGPRPFLPGEPLFGRDREIRELRNLLIAERIVVLYSPSGAGKTSLVQAGLIPKMQESDFHVLPIIRVNQPPRDLNGRSPNRYLESALRSLQHDLSQSEQAQSAVNGLRLDEFLAKQSSPEDDAVAHLLIFDQFEEILTLDPADGPAKSEFFVQVGEALRAPHRWALFSMREDHFAALDPYLRHIPTRLATTYRLGLLEPPAAAEAIQKPAAQAGIDFTEPAVARLIEELVSVRTRLPDGTTKEELLPFVEPVQLQVVCTRFWERLPWSDLPAPDGRPQIEAGHVAELAQVDDALADYYEAKMAAIAAATASEAPLNFERLMREWIDANLITERGTRAQLRVGAEREQTLPEGVIQALVDAYLIRREGRAGDRWYELAHDRMVQPIRESNATWLRTHLEPVQLRARQWDEAGRRRASLLRGSELRRARSWAAANQRHLPHGEQALLADFLGDSLREQKSRNLRIGALTALACLVVATGWWYVQNREAEQQARLSLVQGLVSEALLQRERGQHELGALLARQAFLFDQEAGAPLRHRVDDALRQTLNVDYFNGDAVAASLVGHDRPVTSVAFSPDGTRLASASAGNTIRLWDPANPGASPVTLNGHLGTVTSVTFDAEGQHLFAAGSDGAVGRWSVASPTGDAPQLFDSGYRVGTDSLEARERLVRADHPALAEMKGVRTVALNAVAVSPDGQWLAAGAEFGAVLLWKLATADTPVLLENLGGEVQSVAFSPDSRSLVAGSDRAVAIFDLAQPEAGDPVFEEISADREIAVSPDGRLLASAADFERTVQVRDLADLNAAPHTLASAGGNVLALAFAADGSTLAAGREDGLVQLWDLDHLERDPIALQGHVGAVNAVAFSPDGRMLASGGDDTHVRLWTVDTAALADAVCGVVHRNLSEAEWQHTAGELAYKPTCPGLPPGDASDALALVATPQGAVTGSDATGASQSLFPHPLLLPQRQTFRIERDDLQSLEDLTSGLPDPTQARERMRTWGWEDNATRHFASDDPPPNAAGYIVMNVHRFASDDGAEAALPYLAANRREALGHNAVNVGQIADQTEAMAGRGYNGNEVTIYARRGDRIFQVIGVAAIGDPTRDVQAALKILLDAATAGVD